jgi:hypothetical protein
MPMPINRFTSFSIYSCDIFGGTKANENLISTPNFAAS